VSASTRAEIFRAADGFRFRLRSKANGEVVAQSEGYVRLEDCRHEAEQLVGEDDVEVLD
jgi:uncharacterized protein YegP (UPF0339 family)